MNEDGTFLCVGWKEIGDVSNDSDACIIDYCITNRCRNNDLWVVVIIVGNSKMLAGSFEFPTILPYFVEIFKADLACTWPWSIWTKPDTFPQIFNVHDFVIVIVSTSWVNKTEEFRSPSCTMGTLKCNGSVMFLVSPIKTPLTISALKFQISTFVIHCSQTNCVWALKGDPESEHEK